MKGESFLLVVFYVVIIVLTLLKTNSALPEECRWRTSDEHEDTFVEFMNVLESYTFPRCENGDILSDPEIENTIWDERFVLYDSHMNQTDGCLCEINEAEFQACMVEVRQSMMERVQELIVEINADIIQRCAA